METNFPLESQNRQVKIEKLARELPLLPRSFLDKISDKLITIISATEVQDLYEGRMVPDTLAQPGINHTLDLEKVSRMVETAAAELKLESPITYVKPVFSQGEGGYGARIISSPNGGGKTLALKSFGLAAIMAKLGIPISTTETEIAGGDERRPVVD